MIIEKEKECEGVAFNIAKFKGKLRTTFKEGNRIYNIFLNSEIKIPSFFRASPIDEREINHLEIKTYKYEGELKDISFLRIEYGIITKKFDECLKLKNNMIVKQCETFMALTTYDKLFCFCCSFVDVKVNDIVKIGIIRERNDNKRMLYGVILEKFGFDEGLSRISERFDIKEFFRNIEKKK